MDMLSYVSMSHLAQFYPGNKDRTAVTRYIKRNPSTCFTDRRCLLHQRILKTRLLFKGHSLREVLTAAKYKHVGWAAFPVSKHQLLMETKECSFSEEGGREVRTG